VMRPMCPETGGGNNLEGVVCEPSLPPLPLFLLLSSPGLLSPSPISSSNYTLIENEKGVNTDEIATLAMGTPPSFFSFSLSFHSSFPHCACSMSAVTVWRSRVLENYRMPNTTDVREAPPPSPSFFHTFFPALSTPSFWEKC